jgi:hypothetical protein
MTSLATPAIETLLQIMGDADISTRLRIEACEGLLAYEAPPGVVVQARDYLVAVFKDQEEVLHDRMDALKLARKFEAAKVTPRTIHTTRQESDRREAWRRYEIAERELKIILATKDVPPPGWADDLLSDNYVAPAEGWPGPAPQIPLKDLVTARKTRQNRLEREAIERLRHVSSERPQLLALLASQRRNGDGGDGTDD